MNKFNIVKICLSLLSLICFAKVSFGADAWNVDLVGQINTPGTALQAAIHGTYAYLADGTSGLRIIDISNPNSPIEVGFCNTPGFAYSICIKGNYAYIAAGGSGLRIIDISSTSNPTEVGYYQTPDAAFDVTVEGNYAYVAAYISGLRIIDISNPYNPVEVGHYDTLPSSYPLTYAYSVIVKGDYAYIGDQTTGLRILDISDPINPQKVSVLDTPGNAVKVALQGNYAFIADGYSGFEIVDISNPKSPFEVAYYDTPGYVRDIKINDDYAYIADYNGGFRVFDISNIFHLKEIGYFTNGTYNCGVSFQAPYIYITNFIPYSTGSLLVLYYSPKMHDIPDIKLLQNASLSKGLHLNNYLNYLSSDTWTWSSQTTFANLTIDSASWVNYLTPLSASAGMDTVQFNSAHSESNPSVLKYSTYLLNRFPDVLVDDGYPVSNCRFDLNYYTQNIDIVNPLFYQTQLRCNINRDTARLKITTIANSLTITPQIAPTEVGYNEVSKNASDTFVRGNYAYVADYDFGLFIIDVSNPQSPYLISSCATPGSARDIFVSGNYAYIADHYDGLRIIDVSNPFTPHEIGAYTASIFVNGVYVRDNYAYVAYGGGMYGHLRILDVSDPTSPISVGYYYLNNSEDMNNVFVKDNYAYVANSFAGLKIFDISDPFHIQLAGSYYTQGEAWNVYVRDNYAYLADENSFRVFDVSTPASPRLIGSCNPSGMEFSVYLDRNYAFLGNGKDGLRVVDITTASNPVEVSYLDTPGGAYNVFVSGDYAYVSDYTSGLRIIEVGKHAASLRSPAGIIVTATPDTASNDWDKEVIRVYEIANSYGQFSTGSDTSHWYFEPYGDSAYSGVLSWSSSYQLGAIMQSPGQKAKLSQLFTVPYPGWYTAKAKVGTDVAEISKQQKVYLYIYEFNQDTELVAAASQVLYPGNGGFGDASTGKELQVSFYARNTILGVQLVSINPINSGVWGSLYFDDIWVYPAEPQINRCYGATKVGLLNRTFDDSTIGWILEPYGNARYSGVWTTAYSMLCLTQNGGNKGKASQIVQLPNSGKNASASVWVYSDAISQNETQKVYLYLYSYDSDYRKIIESGNAVLYPGNWTSGQWYQLQVAYTPMTEYAVVQVIGINPVGNSWATLYFDSIAVNQDQDSIYYWDHTLF